MHARRKLKPERVCPRSGKPIRSMPAWVRCWWLSPIIGALALLWFLVRVIPKPSRAAYPCQQFAFSLAAGSVISLLTWPAMLILFRKGRRLLWQRRYLVASLFLAGALGAAWIGLQDAAAPAYAFNPTEGPNAPMGTGRGIHPGRVVWIYDPSATPWNGSTGKWWDDNGTRQESVDDMLSRSLRALSGENSDPAAWEALFRHFNDTRGRGVRGYQAGERIAIKINCNNSTSHTDVDNQADASPHTVLALLRQLVHQAGVAQDRITVYEAPKTAPTRVIPDRIYQKGRAEFPSVLWADCSGSGQRAAIAWATNAITYSVANGCGRDIPTCVRDADYLVNMAIFKCHGTTGVTLTAKNHYGSINKREHTFIKCASQPMGTYSPFVDLTGHRHLGGKTLFFMVDGLFGSSAVGGNPTRFQQPPFNNRWSSSFLLSQDPVAIDSVGLDFLNAEFGHQASMVNADNYLHEAALADSPPSGTSYDPEADGTTLTSLGVHEHWNHPMLRQYSRELGTGQGIELVTLCPIPFKMDGALDGDYEIARRGTDTLHAALRGTRLYVAANPAGDGAGGAYDHFVFVTDAPGGAHAAPWSKSGTVALNPSVKPYLADESANATDVWANGGAWPMCAAWPETAGGCLEGSIDLVEVFGTLPETVYLCFAPYATANGGALDASRQIPAGNGNGNIEADEFLAVPLRAIRDSDANGVPDVLEPDGRFRADLAAGSGGRTVTWPCLPGRSYQVFSTDDLGLAFEPVSSMLVAAAGQFELSFTDARPGESSRRFYRVKLLE